MSHAVARGKPYASQIYLDELLDEILLEQGLKPDVTIRNTVTLPQILYHVLKKNPDGEFMTNGATGEVISNAQLLDNAVSLSRALNAIGLKGKTVMSITRNHQSAAAIYFGNMFSGVIPFMMDPNFTVYELTHFLKLIEPAIVFYDPQYQESLATALEFCNLNPVLLQANAGTGTDGSMEAFVKSFNGDLEGFSVPSANMEDAVLLLPTSGSTGLSKAAIFNHKGLVAQLPCLWAYHDKFPTPTRRVMILTTMQWASFTMSITSCVAYGIPIVTSPRISTPDHVAEMIGKFKPTWGFTSPAFATGLVAAVRGEQLSSLETLILLGAPPSNNLMVALKEKLSSTCHLCDGYGASEAQGFIAIPDKHAPSRSNGWVLNIFDYQIVDENGEKLGLKGTGELYLKGESIITGYYQNSSASDEMLTPDGWYKTGDEFYLDEDERLTFAMRKKFSFKYMGCHVAPEEVERVISSVPGVKETVVTATDNGPAAAVVVIPGSVVTRDQIKQAVNACLSEHKWLHGGVTFVTSLPHTSTGKLQRRECANLITEMIRSGHCF